MDPAQALGVDGEEIAGAIVMIDEESAGGHYDELTALKGVPFVVANAARRGVFGDHLLVSDGTEWAYAEALCESNYPAVRVNTEGTISPGDLADACSYWQVHARALRALESRSRQSTASQRSKE